MQIYEIKYKYIDSPVEYIYKTCQKCAVNAISSFKAKYGYKNIATLGMTLFTQEDRDLLYYTEEKYVCPVCGEYLYKNTHLDKCKLK